MKKLLLLAVLLSGCAPTYWHHPGHPRDAQGQPFDKDAAYCRMVASGVAAPPYVPAVASGTVVGPQGLYRYQADPGAAMLQGYAMGEAIAQQRAQRQRFTDCLTYLGWEKVAPKEATKRP